MDERVVRRAIPFRPAGQPCRRSLYLAASFAALLGGAAGAAESNSPDISWDNTLKLGTSDQLHAASSNYCAGAPGQSENYGCGYAEGFTPIQIDWLSQLDIAYRDAGIHLSSAARYDVWKPQATYSSDRYIELYEAFVHGTVDLGENQPLSFRIGRHTLIWGESQFFPENGIAAGQTPIDTTGVKGIDTYQAHDIFLPVGQTSFSWRVADDVAIEGYYQFEWRGDRIDPGDASASAGTVFDTKQGEPITLQTASGPHLYTRVDNDTPASHDQFGLAVKWRLGDYDLGVYGLDYDAKTPTVTFYGNGTYGLADATGIALVGLSVAGPLADGTFGTELSARRDMPLVNGGLFVRGHAGYSEANAGGAGIGPRGDTLHLQISLNREIAPIRGFSDGADWTTEIAGNHLLRVTSDPTALVPGRTSTAAAVRTVLASRFYQVLPRIDLSVPIGVSYNFLGLSQVLPDMNRGTGEANIGIAATLDRRWTGTLSATRYFGRSKIPFLNATGPGEALADWNDVAMTIQYSF